MASTNSTLQGILNDMGRFLGETLVGQPISPSAELERYWLLQRMEPYVTDAKICVNGPTGMKYSSMEEEEYEEPSVVLTRKPTSSSSSSEQSEDSSLPYSTLQDKTLKCGPLWRKEKVAFLDMWRKYCTALYGHFILMYCSEREVKPYASVNIQGYVARPAPNYTRDPKRKAATFEIVCPGKRDYQFFARTAKDMHQWVTAICQASIQHIQITISAFQNQNLDEVPALPDSHSSKMYDDDSASVMTLNGGDGNQIYELEQSAEEEFYHHIEDVYQGKLGPNSKPGFDVKPVEKSPQLLPQRPLPSIPHTKVQRSVGEGHKNVNTKEFPPLPPRRQIPPIPQVDLSNQEPIYDDIGVSVQHNEYPNMTGIGEEKHTEAQQSVGTEEGHTNVRPDVCVTKRHIKERLQQSVEHEVQFFEEEVIYDDAEVAEKLPQAINPPVLQQESSVRNGSNIQNRIKLLQASLPTGNIPVGCHYSNIPNKIPSNTSSLNKSMKNIREDTMPSLPQTLVTSHNLKPYPLNQSFQSIESTLYRRTKNIGGKTEFSPPTTPLSPTPPELPPRSYLRR